MRLKKPLLIAAGLAAAGLAAVGLAAVGLAAFAAAVAAQPSEFRIVRSATIDAPPGVVFAHVDDLRAWHAWSPWVERDPNATMTFSGPPAGEGAAADWAGNDEVGEGRMTIVESRPDESIRLRLDFRKPFEDTADVEFAFAPDGGGTRVTWAMSGRNNFVGKAFCLFMDMDAMIGGDFEHGLAKLKAVAEPAAGE